MWLSYIYRDEVIAIYDAVHSLRLLRCDLYSRTELALVWKRPASRQSKLTA